MPLFKYPLQVMEAHCMSGGEFVPFEPELTTSAVPIVVAKCGLYLKENATEVEGTFRISGSAKRMRELQAVFDTDPKVRPLWYPQC